MNYRHAYHAGNFADVFKHVILTRIVTYLKRKDAAFRVIDTHAGEGIYDLSAEAAEKTSEWRSGIGRLVAANAPPDVEGLLEPYLSIVTPMLAGEPALYPGSPAIARLLLRPQDRMIFCDSHPQVVAALKRRPEFGRDDRVKVIEIDGFVALNAYVPPVERRGVVLVDPAFEHKTEFDQILATLSEAVRKWPTGIYMIWYPLKERAGPNRFVRALVPAMAEAGNTKILRLELQVDAPQPDGPVKATGLVIINPPFVLEDEARVLSPYLARSMGLPGKYGADIAWLARD